MSTATFTYTPLISYEDYDDAGRIIFRYAGTGTEQRAKTQAIAYRRYTWPIRVSTSDKLAVNEFVRLRNDGTEAFYIRDPKDNARTGVSLGTSVSGQTGFTLPTTGDNQRDYPISSATVTVYDDGVEASGTVTIDQDARRFTLSVAPTSGSVMTADYHYYRLVRLEGVVKWAGLAPDWHEGSLSLWEVPG